ncbi:hypothetical protein BT96DRAFT_492452 [Gymnopus androsaceus JB14]|uniref:Uncharacterized protein n=1 Tax=Gymnopus androsaceus JB14 TaxID=1447944 RepID=A0A6A4GPJ6_9AGAR|nr:hypothetical protein BT96DRAFT_492452 [Gymnopus androsaceus JB14]
MKTSRIQSALISPLKQTSGLGNFIKDFTGHVLRGQIFQTNSSQHGENIERFMQNPKLALLHIINLAIVSIASYISYGIDDLCNSANVWFMILFLVFLFLCVFPYVVFFLFSLSSSASPGSVMQYVIHHESFCTYCLQACQDSKF